MRPFGYPVTILNTLDPLGKFDRKVDEGFLVGYSVSSKAFKVCNSRTRIVQETLHINFLKNKPNVACSGPTWLFDIDTITKSMNYQPVTAGNQSNLSAGVQEQFDVEKAGEENVQQYVLFPLWSSGSKNPQNTDDDVAFEGKKPEFESEKPESEVHVSPSSSAKTKKHDDKTKKEAKGKIPTVGKISTNNINTFSAAALEDITYSDDKEDVSEADFTNLETNITVSPIPTTRVHKDHHVTQIIGTKWVFRNKKNERGILVKKKARLVVQGHTQEEGIYYEEVFAPVARIEAIRLFLAYASFIGFMVYQIDVKSAFLYGTIEKEVYVDDIIFGSTNKDLCKAFEKLMKDKFQMGSMDEKSASTPKDTEKPLLKDPDGYTQSFTHACSQEDL
nr:ribonuclease H-like domain-containing protein [Tanacetum cinerariifolium]